MGEVGAAQVAFAEDDAGEIGCVEVGFDEIAVLEDAVFEASHAHQGEIELALMKQHAAPLCLIAGGAGEPRGSDFYAFEHAAGEVDIREVGIIDMRVAHPQSLRAGVGERGAAEAAAFDGDGLPARTQERGQSGICHQSVVNRARCELFSEIRGEKGVIEAWRDAAFGLADHA